MDETLGRLTNLTVFEFLSLIQSEIKVNFDPNISFDVSNFSYEKISPLTTLIYDDQEKDMVFKIEEDCSYTESFFLFANNSIVRDNKMYRINGKYVLEKGKLKPNLNMILCYNNRQRYYFLYKNENDETVVMIRHADGFKVNPFNLYGIPVIYRQYNSKIGNYHVLPCDDDILNPFELSTVSKEIWYWIERNDIMIDNDGDILDEESLTMFNIKFHDWIKENMEDYFNDKS